MTLSRRHVIAGGGIAILGGYALFGGGRDSRAKSGHFEVRYSEAEWRRRLTGR